MPRTKGTTDSKKNKKVTKPQAKSKAATSKGANVSKTKPELNIKETPKNSEIILDYSRFGNIGFSTMHETISISGLKLKKFTGKITTLFHFLRNTPVTSNHDTGKTAIFQIDGKPILGITQKAGNYDESVFIVTKYKSDGSKQSTRKYSYAKTKNLILQAFGFDVKMDKDEDIEQLEESEISSDDMKIQPDTGNFEDGIDNGFDDVD